MCEPTHRSARLIGHIGSSIAIEQGRRLSVLDSCFRNRNQNSPQKFLDLEAVRVKSCANMGNGLAQQVGSD